MIYEHNLSQLKYSEHDIYEKICDPDFCWDGSRAIVEYAKNEEPILVYIREDDRKEYLNSRYNPTKEAENSWKTALICLKSNFGFDWFWKRRAHSRIHVEIEERKYKLYCV